MPRRARAIGPDVIYHVLNRAAKRLILFKTAKDYSAFEQILFGLTIETGMRLLSYCIMPNHWRLVLRPRTAKALSDFMCRLTVTHALRWHAFHKTGGTGPVYQGRYKATPVQQDNHFILLCRYVERNPVRARLVNRSEDWNWCSLSLRSKNTVAGKDPHFGSTKRASGEEAWVIETARELGLESTLRPRGRPRKGSRPLLPDP